MIIDDAIKIIDASQEISSGRTTVATSRFSFQEYDSTTNGVVSFPSGTQENLDDRYSRFYGVPQPIFHLKPESLKDFDDDAVLTQWDDSSANLNHVTPVTDAVATGITVVHNELRGFSVARFRGPFIAGSNPDEHLVADFEFEDSGVITNERTVFMVLNPATGLQIDTADLFIDFGVTTQFVIELTRINAHRVDHNFAVSHPGKLNLNVSVQNVPFDGWRIISMQYHDNAIEGHINEISVTASGLDVGEVATSYSDGTQPPKVGHFYIGDMAELIVYDEILSISIHASILRQLKGKYGLELGI